MAQQESTVWRASSTCICSAVTKPPEALQPPPVPCFLSFSPAAPLSPWYSCLPAVPQFSCLSFLLPALYFHDRLRVSPSTFLLDARLLAVPRLR